MLSANILWYLNFCLRKKESRLRAYLQGNVMWMLTLFLLTEILSVFHGLSDAALWIAWIIVDIFLLTALCIRSRKEKVNGKQFLKDCFPLLSFIRERGSLLFAAIGGIVLFLAAWTVPYNWDSMTYRLSRVSYWAQNGSVEHFANSSMRMIANPPLGEFIQLHVYLMSGGDKMLTLIQAFAFLTCSAAVYGISRKINCDKTFSKLAVLLFMSMPIAFAEALNTQVDLLATLWLLIFIYLLIDFVYSKEKIAWSGSNVFQVCVMGLCVAWGYLTKPSVCVAMAVFCLWLLVNCIVRKDRIFTLLRLAGCALAGMLVPMGWEIARNLKTFHAISSPLAGERQLIGTLQPAYVLVNGLKNIVHNLPTVFLNQMTDFMEKAVRKTADILNVELDAESIAEGGMAYKLWNPPEYAHDMAINPLLAWLMIICIIGCIWRFRRLPRKKWYQSYALAAFLSFFVFCFVLRWEYYVTRYMVSFFAAACPAVALCLQGMTEQKGKEHWRYGTVGAIAVLCVLEVANMTIYHRNICVRSGANERPTGYFAFRQAEYEPTMAICQFIQENDFRELGIFQSGDDFEYPYWAILDEQRERMEHVNMYDESAVYLDREYQPECIIWLGAFPEEKLEWNGQTYRKGFEAAENRYVLIPAE